MNTVEEMLRAELRPELASGATPDWSEVARRAGLDRSRARRRRWSLALAFAVMVVLLGLATPLGAALVRELDGFSAWLTGQPGKPASSEQQREFDAENARSWVGFPAGTELRRLVVRHIAGGTVELEGFRPGSTRFCLRLTVTGATRATRTACAPLYELRQTGPPVRLVMVDVPVGYGTKTAWSGDPLNELRSSRLQITAGIAADGVRAVVLDDEAGTHRVPAVANSFLYVAEQPGVGQRVREVSAVTANGAVPVPFVPIPSRRPSPALAPPAPTIERTVPSGRIGWLDRGEARGEPLTALPTRIRADLPGARLGRIVFGRVVTPDPDRPDRMALTLNSQRRGGMPVGVCTLLVQQGGGGCAGYPGVFDRGPISASVSGNGTDEFVTLYGFASDDVARIEALLPDGRHVEVPLADNAFIVDIASSRLPARLVAYDSEDRAIGSTEPLADFNGWPGPARTRVMLLRAAGPNGAHFELLVGPASDGGECMYLRRYIDAQHAGTGIDCNPRTPQDWPLQVVTEGNPTIFLGGRVRSDIETIRVVFADGTHHDIRPTRGYVLYATPRNRLDTAHAPVRVEARTANGRVLQTVHLRPGR